MRVYRALSLLLVALTAIAIGCTPENVPTPPPTPEEPKPAFEAEITKVGRTTMEFSVTPLDPDADYFIYVMECAEADDFTKDEYIVATIYQELSDKAASEGKLFAEYMAEWVDRGSVEGSFSGLSLDTEYYLLIFGVDAAAEYELSTELYRFPFRTLSVEQSEAGFEVKTTVVNNSVTFNVKPDDPSMSWHLFSVTRAMLEEYTSPEGEVGWSEDYFFSMYFQDEINNMLQSGYSQEEVIRMLIFSGELELTASGLNANTEYAYMVAGLTLDEEGLFITTGVTTGYYTTGDAALSDMTFEIEVFDIGQMSASFTITPSNNTDKYCALVAPWDGITEADAMMHKIVDQWGGWMSVMANDRGPVIHTDFKLPAAGTDYYIIAFGYDGGITTEAYMATFRTLDGGKPEDAQFEMSASNISPYGFDLKIVSSDPTIYYTLGVCTPEEYDEELFVQLEEENFEYIFTESQGFNPSITRAEIFDQYYYNDNTQLSVSGVAPETEFMGYIYIFDIASGKILRCITFEELTRTSALGSVTPTIELVGYYSGDEEAGSIFGEPTATKGKAITVVKYSNLDGARTLFTTMVGDDCTNATAFPDAELWGLTAGLWRTCKVSQPYTFYTAEWAYPQTALSYAVDTSGAPGRIARLYTEATAEEKRPIEELRQLYEELNSTTSALSIESVVIGDKPATLSTSWRTTPDVEPTQQSSMPRLL